MLEEALPIKTHPEAYLTKEELAKQEENVMEYLLDRENLKVPF